MYVKDNVVPSKFKWCPDSPKKRKAPLARLPVEPTKKAKPSTSTFLLPETSKADTDEERHIPEDEKFKERTLPEELERKLSSIERELQEANARIIKLENENSVLLCVAENRIECMSRRIFNLERFKSDEDMSFYTGFPNYATFLATFEFLNPGFEGENIRYCSSSERVIPAEFYDEVEEQDLEREKQGRPRKLKPIDEFFMVM